LGFKGLSVCYLAKHPKSKKITDPLVDTARDGPRGAAITLRRRSVSGAPAGYPGNKALN